VYARALTIREKILSPRHPDVLQSLTNLALNGWARAQYSRALALFQRAQAIQLKNSEQFLFSGSESRQRAYVESYAEDTYARVSFSLAMSPVNMPVSRGALELSLDSVLQYKGRVLETASDNVARLRRSISGEDRVLMDRLGRIANQSSKVLYQGLGDSSPDRRNRRLTELTRQQDALEAQLAKRSSEFREQTQLLTVANVRQAIPKEAALVEWVRYKPFDPKASHVAAQWGPPRYAAYVLTALDAPTVVDLGEAAELDRLATDFNLAVSDPKRDDVSQRASALSKKLIEPLLPQLRGRSRWLLSPDGALNLVSMAALLDSDGHYLAEHFEITYLSSGRDLLRVASATPHASTQPAVLVADPDYGALPAQAITLAQARQSDLGSGGLIFRPLPGTALEAQSLQKLLEPRAAAVLMHGNASEEQLRALHGPRLLHIATHGFFLSDDAVKTTESGAALTMPNHNPLLRAGLALAGANMRRSGASDDGILTAQEMAQLDLRGTELVVLSACETATGEAASGEGIYGMRRALVLAGAQAQVTSLWQVSDQATRMLMVNFYRRLLQGDGRSAALRAAQRDMMADPIRRHPYYWAGFVPVGDWRPLTPRH
jgi:CHAT domain-containing protein